MKFLKFVTKTVVVTAVCSIMFNTIIDKTLSSQAKEDIKNGSKKIMNLVSSKGENDEADIDDESIVSEEPTDENEELTNEVDVSEDISIVEEAPASEDIPVNEKSANRSDVPENILTNKNDNFIFIGDSRTVAYKDIVDATKYDFITFISEISKGYKWLDEVAIEKLNNRFDTTDLSYNVVLNLGINDLHNLDKYIEVYNELAEKNPKHNFFVVSVNKVYTDKMVEKGYAPIENSQVEEFNSKMKNSLSDKIHFIDSYTHFKDKDLESNDGLHYSSKMSGEILDYICDYIKAL